jgi:hypothetical protein
MLMKGRKIMRKPLHQVRHPMRSIVVTATVVPAETTGTQASAIAAPASGAGNTARQVNTTQETREFDGFGAGRSAFIALRAARNAARQATTAGFSTCSTSFEESGFDPGLRSYVAESDLSCERQQ